MRSFFYWLFSIALATLATAASDHADRNGGFLWSPDLAADVLPVPEPSRAILLGVGILAIAFTYRQAWLNLKRRN